MIMIVIYSAMTGSIAVLSIEELAAKQDWGLTSVGTEIASCKFILNGFLRKKNKLGE